MITLSMSTHVCTLIFSRVYCDLQYFEKKNSRIYSLYNASRITLIVSISDLLQLNRPNPNVKRVNKGKSESCMFLDSSLLTVHELLGDFRS